MTFVLDASALLRFTDREPGAERVRALLHRAGSGGITLLMSSVNWGEVVSVLHKQHGPVGARVMAANLSSLPITIKAVDAAAAESAGIFKNEFGVPYADAFAGSLALREKATLVTADFDFKSVSKATLAVEFLPKK